MKISPYTIYLEMQRDALVVRQNFIICKKWVFINDGCNLLLMMVVTITKIFFFKWFQYVD
jgi:hypothetical protein